MEREYLIKPLMNHHYPMVDYAKGVYIYDIEGKKYLDGSSGAITSSIGHGVTEIIEVMTNQGNKVAFTYRSQFTNEPAEQLAKLLASLTPGDLNWSFFVNSGTEAVETAMKIAIQHFQEKGNDSKKIILSRKMSYHGITIGALSLSGHKVRRKRFETLLENYPVVEAPYCKRCPFGSTYPECQLACAKDLEVKIMDIGAEKIAAFIAEPIVGAAGGALTPPPGYYEEIRNICTRNHILFIADEVMTGLGRTGETFGINHWNVTPDILALGKGLTAGYTPMAATIATDQVIQPILDGSKLVMSGHTFSGNPLSSAIALAVVQYVMSDNLVTHSKEKGIYLKSRLEEMKNRYAMLTDIRGKGLMIGIELDESYFKLSKGAPTNQILAKAKDYGLLLYPAVAGEEGIEEIALLIAPPLTISRDEIEELLFLFEKTLQSFMKKEENE